MNTIIIALLTFSLNMNQFNDQIYQAYVNSDIGKWENALDNFSVLLSSGSSSEIYNYAMGYYGLIGYYIGTGQEDKAEEKLKIVENITERMLKEYPNDSRFNALRGALYGFRIGFDKYKAIYLGPRSEEHIDNAVELDPLNPVAWIEYGNKMYYMPEFLGGSKHEAIESYHKAIRLYEKQQNQFPSWLYLNSIAILGTWYEANGQPTKALKMYEKALQIEPDFKWVKDELYLNLKKKLKVEV